MGNPQKDQIADFSKYMDKAKPAASKQNSAITEKPSRKKLPRRILIMIAILVVLAIAQLLVIYYSRPPRPQALPANPTQINE